MQIISLGATPEMPVTQWGAGSEEVTRSTNSALEVSWAAILALLTGEAAAGLPVCEAGSRTGGPERAGAKYANCTNGDAVVRQPAPVPAAASKPVRVAADGEPVTEEKPETEQPEAVPGQEHVGAAVQQYVLPEQLPAGFVLVPVLPPAWMVAERPDPGSENERENKPPAKTPPVARPVATTSLPTRTSPAELEGPTRAWPSSRQLPVSPPLDLISETASSVPPAGVLAAQLSPPAQALWSAVAAPPARPGGGEIPSPASLPVPAVGEPVRPLRRDHSEEQVRSQLLPEQANIPAGQPGADAGTTGQILPGPSGSVAVSAKDSDSRIAAAVEIRGRGESTGLPLLAAPATTAVLVTQIPKMRTDARPAAWVRYELVADESLAVRAEAKPTAVAVEEGPDPQAISLRREPAERQAVAKELELPLRSEAAFAPLTHPRDTSRGEMVEARALRGQGSASQPQTPTRATPSAGIEAASSPPKPRLAVTIAFSSPSAPSDGIAEPNTVYSQLPETNRERIVNPAEQKYAAMNRQLGREADGKVPEGLLRAADSPPKAAKAVDVAGPDRQDPNSGEGVLVRGHWENGVPVTGTQGDHPSPNRPVATSSASFSHRLLDEVERLQQLRDERRLSDPVHRISMLLEPPELGMVEATVDLRHGEVRIRMTAHTAAGEAALTGQLDSLRAAMTERGLTVGELRVISAGSANGEASLQQATSGFITSQGFQGNPRGGWYRPGDDELPALRVGASIRRRSSGRAATKVNGDGSDGALPTAERPRGIAAGGLDVTA